MNPDVSRAVGRIRNVLQLAVDDPRLDELLTAAQSARSLSDLPDWALAALPTTAARSQAAIARRIHVWQASR